MFQTERTITNHTLHWKMQCVRYDLKHSLGKCKLFKYIKIYLYVPKEAFFFQSGNLYQFIYHLHWFFSQQEPAAAAGESRISLPSSMARSKKAQVKVSYKPEAPKPSSQKRGCQHSLFLQPHVLSRFHYKLLNLTQVKSTKISGIHYRHRTQWIC